MLCFVRRWSRNWDLWRNFKSHSSHENGFSPVWILIWDLRVWRWRNLEINLELNTIDSFCQRQYRLRGFVRLFYLVPQTWQGYGFSPVWIRIWARRCATWTNRAEHVSHLYGFSPEWILKWVLRFAGRLNWASQIGHLYGLLPKINNYQMSHLEWVILTVFFFIFWSDSLFRWRCIHFFGLMMRTTLMISTTVIMVMTVAMTVWSCYWSNAWL